MYLSATPSLPYLFCVEPLGSSKSLPSFSLKLGLTISSLPQDHLFGLGVFFWKTYPDPFNGLGLCKIQSRTVSVLDIFRD